MVITAVTAERRRDLDRGGEGRGVRVHASGQSPQPVPVASNI
jgi:hypothetical protein